MPSWSFVILGFPVTVQPWFWLMAVIMGASLRPETLPAWMLVVFVSILVHELGHAFMARTYGLRSAIELHAFGGVAYSQRERPLAPWQDIWISLAGPGAGFVLGGAMLLASLMAPDSLRYHSFFGALLYYGVWVNFAWGLLNLLPVLPLDGGNVMRLLIRRYVLRPATDLPLRISVAVGGGAALLGLLSGSTWMMILFGWLAFSNYQDLTRLGSLRGR